MTTLQNSSQDESYMEECTLYTEQYGRTYSVIGVTFPSDSLALVSLRVTLPDDSLAQHVTVCQCT